MDFWVLWWLWSMLTFGSLGIVNHLFLKPFWMEDLAWILMLVALTYGFCFGQWGDLLPKPLFYVAAAGIVVVIIAPAWAFFASSVLRRSLSPDTETTALSIFKALPMSIKWIFAAIYLNFVVYMLVMLILGIIIMKR